MKKYLIAIVLVSVMLFLFAGLGFAIWRKPIESPEVAAWVQAIGSIAAIGGAVWIYQSQERQRRKQEMDSARITAAHIVHRIVLLQAEVKSHVELLLEVAQVDGNPKVFKYFCDRLDGLPNCTLDELVRLAPLGKESGLKLSAALDIVGSARSICRVAVNDPRMESNSDVRKTYAATTGKQLGIAMDMLSSVLDDIGAIAKSVR